MSSVVKTGNAAHDNACASALSALHGSIAGVTSQVTINSAYITFHRAVVSSCKTNNSGSGLGPSMDALRSLGVQS